jgi:hypothetical protein
MTLLKFQCRERRDAWYCDIVRDILDKLVTKTGGMLLKFQYG